MLLVSHPDPHPSPRILASPREPLLPLMEWLSRRTGEDEIDPARRDRRACKGTGSGSLSAANSSGDPNASGEDEETDDGPAADEDP